ncbi:hypothetical protein [Tunturiibacter gelidiferens]|uniref:hypothetical protein n=1 Tax=Tunturiibacter gelidiferens TaxID=3069689 RepID=UPI003D9BC8F7
MQQSGGSYFPKLTELLEQIQIKDRCAQPRFILGRHPERSERSPQFVFVLFSPAMFNYSDSDIARKQLSHFAAVTRA